jgi:hypothetical protein
MAHINSIGAGLFSDVSVAMPATAPVFKDLDTAAEFNPLFATEIASTGGTKAPGTFVRIGNVRTFPAIGTPANIVKVPTYGQRTSQSIQGQADAPQLEFDLNFVAADWAKEAGVLLGNAVGDGNQYVFRFALLNAEPSGQLANAGAVVLATRYASLALAAGGLGTVQNSVYYWVGKMEALLVTPSLTDANTAKLSTSIQSSFFGAYTL